MRGVFSASFLAAVERVIGGSVADYFDLIAGISTGAIIAVGLGFVLSTEDILRFYRTSGPSMFAVRYRFRPFGGSERPGTTPTFLSRRYARGLAIGRSKAALSAY